MPSEKFSLEENEKYRLKIQWQGGWFSTEKDFQIFLDGKLIGTIPERKSIENGCNFQLESGRILSVQLINNDFQVIYNHQNIENFRPLSLKIGSAIAIALVILGSVFDWQIIDWPILNIIVSIIFVVIGVSFVVRKQTSIQNHSLWWLLFLWFYSLCYFFVWFQAGEATFFTFFMLTMSVILTALTILTIPRAKTSK